MSKKKQTTPEPGSHGVVVDHKEAKARYAVAPEFFDPAQHDYVRELEPGESVRGFIPKSLPDEKEDQAAEDEPDAGKTDEPLDLSGLNFN